MLEELLQHYVLRQPGRERNRGLPSRGDVWVGAATKQKPKEVKVLLANGYGERRSRCVSEGNFTRLLG
jgi:hypothetical protein